VASSPVRVLGIDPGTRVLGWGVVESRGRGFACLGHGVVRPRRQDPMPLRLAAIAVELRAIIARHAPAEAAMEEAFHGRDARAALRLGEGRGAILLVLAEAGLPVTGYANNVVKRAVTGAGRAAKEHVAAVVSRLLALDVPPATLDATDALALGLCHLQRGAQAGLEATGPSERVRQAVKRAREADRRPRGNPRDALPPRP
jgi:crossover junction endodeoxyribonuclease RuvC